MSRFSESFRSARSVLSAAAIVAAVCGTVASAQVANDSTPAAELAPEISGTSFVYSTELRLGGELYWGLADLEFRLFASVDGTDEISAAPVAFDSVEVFDGMIMVELDFGIDIFDRSDLWLEVMVGGVTITPRTRLGEVAFGGTADQDSIDLLEHMDGSDDPSDPKSDVAKQNAAGGTQRGAIKTGRATIDADAAAMRTEGLRPPFAPADPQQDDGGTGRSASGWTETAAKIWTTVTRVGIGTSNPAYKLDIRGSELSRLLNIDNRSTTGQARAIYGQTFSNIGRAIEGRSMHTTGVTHGLTGFVNSPNGFAAHFSGVAGSKNYFQRNVGIGTTNPLNPLSVVGNTDISGRVGIGQQPDGTASLIVNGGIRARGGAPGPSGSSNNGYAFSGSSGDNDSGMFSTADGLIQFFTNATERARFSSSGNMSLGTTSSTHRLTIKGSSNSVLRLLGTGGSVESGARLNWGDSEFVYIDEPVDDNMRIQATRVGIGRQPLVHRLEVEGGASKGTAGDWGANSDRRIKSDIRSLDNALEVIRRTRPVSFTYSDWYVSEHPSIEPKTYYNVIAQEFAEVFPDWVIGSGEFLPTGEQILQVDTYPMQMYSVAAVKELDAIVQRQHATITSLEAQNAELTERLEQVEKALRLLGVMP
jgi:hypothetical protein